MRDICKSSPLNASISRKPFSQPASWIALLVLGALLATLWPARADDPDDLYSQVFDLVQQAQTLEKEHQRAPALAKYRQAQADLQNLRSEYPVWQRTLVAWRANFLAAKIDALSQKPAPSSTRPGPSSTQPGAPQTQSQQSTAPAQSSGEQVKLLDAGAAPRQKLRFHPKVGDKQTVEMTLDIASGTKMGQMQMPAPKMPPMRITADTTVQDVSPNGDITYQLVIADAAAGGETGGLPQAAAMMKATLGAVKGLSETVKVSSRGIKEESHLEAPSGASPQVNQTAQQLLHSLSDLFVPLPEEAVGAGARWQATTQVKSQGMTIDQTSDNQLDSIQDDHLTVQAKLTESAHNQTISNPVMPAMKLHVARVAGQGTGKMTLDLARLLPQDGSVTMHTEVAMSVAAGGRRQSITATTDMKMEMHSK
jgi:Family of unknown function (DUF6263)